MSREVTELRHQGKLKEAYELAIREREQEPGEWADAALFWVLYDMAKLHLLKSDSQAKAEAKRCIDIMQELTSTMADSNGLGKENLKRLQRMLIPYFDELKILSEQSKSNPREAYTKALALCGTQGERIDAELHEDFGWIVYRYMRERLTELTSLEVRGLLRDYIKLKNPRPSMLHSMILNFASNFARENQDFVFPSFMKLCGLQNFRAEDKREGYKDGNDIPSLLSRVCSTLTFYPDRLIDELSQNTRVNKAEIADMQSKAIFWQLQDYKKNSDLNAFWQLAKDYFAEYMPYAGTHWHTEILGLITRSADDNSRDNFLVVAETIMPYTIKDEDFSAQKGTDGNDYPAPVIQFVRKCYGFAKADSGVRSRSTLMMFLDESYGIIENKSKADENILREWAKVLVWSNKKEKALPIYRKLLLSQGEKYYIWQEAGECIDDAKLQAGFYLRALELEKTEDIIGPLRIKTAKALASIGMKSEARKLLDAYSAHRTRQGKNVSDEWRDADAIVSSATEVPLSPHELVDAAMDYAFEEYESKQFVMTDKFNIEGKTMLVFSDKDTSFVVPQKRFNLKGLHPGSVVSVRAIKKIEYTVTQTFPYRQTETIKYVPLTIKPVDAPAWSILPAEIGYISYENADKNAYTVITSSSSETFFKNKSGKFHKGDFIKFRQYTSLRDGKKTIMIAEPQPCPKEKALPLFNTRVVAVDGVNPSKSLFHIVMGKGLVSDVVRYSDTSLRPNVGDLLNIIYCIRKDKQEKKHIVFLQISPAEDGTTSTLLQSEEGELRTNRNKQGKTFGFVGDTYIPAELLDKAGADEDDTVRVLSVMTPEGKWKAYSLEIIQKDQPYDFDLDDN